MWIVVNLYQHAHSQDNLDVIVDLELWLEMPTLKAHKIVQHKYVNKTRLYLVVFC